MTKFQLLYTVMKTMGNNSSNASVGLTATITTDSTPSGGGDGIVSAAEFAGQGGNFTTRVGFTGSAVRAGDTIVVDGQLKLQDGAAVSVLGDKPAANDKPAAKK